MSWLWFLLGLFLDSVVNYPLLKWTQRRYAKKAYSIVDVWTFVAFASIMVLWGVFMWALVGNGSHCNDNTTVCPEGKNRTEMLILLGIMLVNFGMYFILPTLVSKYETGYKYSNLLKLIGPIAAILMNQVRDGKNQSDMYRFVS